MKRIGLLFPAVVLVAGLAVAGCSSDDDDLSCQDAAQCDRNGQAIKACCNEDGTQCEYQAGDQTFPCNGIDCSDAAFTVADYCRG